MELVCKLGKWLEDLLFDIIPEHSQTLHILRVKEAESEKKVLNLAAPLEILDLAPAAVVDG